MLQIINNILSEEILSEFNNILANAEFVNGKNSAGKDAKLVKNNLELSLNEPKRDLLNKAVMGAIMLSDEFKAATMPLKISTPIFAKYLTGMTYGYHVDDPIMGVTPAQYRSDIAVTLFLNAETDYDGGELSIKTNYGEQLIKLNAGAMVVYPASSRHRVLPIISGERLVMVTWLQSMIKQAEQRQILFDLWQVQQSANNDLLAVSYANLFRMWAET